MKPDGNTRSIQKKSTRNGNYMWVNIWLSFFFFTLYSITDSLDKNNNNEAWSFLTYAKAKCMTTAQGVGGEKWKQKPGYQGCQNGKGKKTRVPDMPAEYMNQY